MTRANLQAFLDRDWAAARASKDQAVAAWVRAHGASAAFRLAQALVDQAWPRLQREPRSDLAGLVELRKKLQRAAAKRRRAARTHR